MAAAGKQGAFWYTLEELSKHWERIDVICPQVGNAECKMQNAKFSNVYFHPSSKGLWYQKYWIQKKGIELFKSHRYTVITSHDYPPFYNARGAAVLSKKFAVPFVSEVHHIVGWPKAASPIEWLGTLWSRIALPSIAKQAQAVRVVNSTVRNELLRWGVAEEKVHVLPSFYLDATALQPKNVEKKFDLVFVGRLVANKGVEKLLVAMNKLAGASLLIIGDGMQRKHYQQLAKNIGVADRVTFLGWLPSQADVIEHMQMAKVFVMPSTSEGGPRSALEAMACGLPVVVTQVGVMPDVIQNSENGLFTSGTPDDIAEKVALLLSDEDWRSRMGHNATHILDRYNRTDLIQKYTDFLSAVAQ